MDKKTQHERKKSKKKKYFETFSQTCFRAHWFTMTNLWLITAIIKIEAETPKRCRGQRILLSMFKFFTHCPLQILHLWPKYFAPRTFPVHKEASISPYFIPFQSRYSYWTCMDWWTGVEQFPITHVRFNIINTVLYLKKKKRWCKQDALYM